MTQISSLGREDEDPSPNGAGGLADVPVREFDLPRIERAVREILVAIGEDPDRDGLRDTPARLSLIHI